MSWCKECNKGLPDNLEKCPECGGVLFENPVNEEEAPLPEIKWLVVARKTGFVLGSLIKSRLESAGIPTMAKGSTFQAVQTYVTPDTRILVPENHLEEAKAIVDQMLASAKDGLFCNVCGSAVSEEDDVCPNCRADFRAQEKEPPYDFLKSIQWVTVAQNTGEILGKLIKSSLENDGIPVTMTGSQADSVLVYDTFDSKIRVPKRFYDRAKEIADDILSGANELDNCLKCGAEISEEDEVCPKCGEEITFGEPSDDQS